MLSNIKKKLKTKHYKPPDDSNICNTQFWQAIKLESNQMSRCYFWGKTKDIILNGSWVNNSQNSDPTEKFYKSNNPFFQ